MSWPLPQDFNEAVQNPFTCFSDLDLMTGETIVGPTGLPLPRSGNFADVYQIRAADNRNWAIKCFTRPVTGLEHRYKKVEEALNRAEFPFTIGFTFLKEGVRIRNEWTPGVKMEWVDGLLLNQVVRDQAGNPKVLDVLCQMWSRLCKRLREAGIAHADLQHGNVLLIAGSKPGSYGLKLIDYDGMYVPALANTPSGESGHPNFQHPTRVTKRVYSPDLDRFPHLVIATALKGLSVLGPRLWERYDSGDNLLFTEEDFRTPANSKLLKELWQSKHPGLQSLTGHLAIACGKPITQTPWLDQVAPDGIVIPLSREQAKTAAAVLGIGLPGEIAASDSSEYDEDEATNVELVSESPDDFSSLDGETSKAEPAKASKPVAKSSPKIPIVIALGVLFLICSVLIGGFVMWGGKNGQTNPDEAKDIGKGNPPGKTAGKPSTDRGKTLLPQPPSKPELLNTIAWQVIEQNTPAHIYQTGISPDGKLFFGAGDAGPSGSIRVFELLTGTQVAELRPGPNVWFSFAAFVHGSKYLAAAYSEDKDIYLWDIEATKVVRKFSGHTERGIGFAISNDGQRILSWSDDKTVRVWNLATGEQLHELKGHTDKAAGTFSRDGKKILTFSPDKTLRLWDVESGKELQQLTGHENACTGSFSADSKQVVSFSLDQPVRLWDVETGKEIRQFWGGGVKDGVRGFIAGGSQVAAYCDDRKYRIWETSSGRILRPIDLSDFGEDRWTITASPDGRLGLVSHDDDAVRVLDLTTGKEIHRYENCHKARSFSFTPDGNYAVAGSFRAGLFVFRLPSTKPVKP
jgi:WD40 repeat protein